MEPLVGYFNNLVVLRGDLTGDPTVRELLRRNRAVVLEAFDHQGAPFQDVAALPDVATVPLVRGLFVLQEAAEHPLEMSGLSVSPLAVEAETADFAIGVFMRERGDQFRAVVRFQRSALTPDEVEALMARFASVLGAMCARPDAPRSQVAPVDADTLTATRHSTGAGPARPTTLLESQLVEIWERLFKRSPISIHDDFFDLGGHSLLAAELLAELEREIVDEPMPLATLFRAPTIAQLADVITRGGWRDSWASLVPIQPEGSAPPLFFVHAHGGNVIGYRDLAKRLGRDQPFYGLQSPEKAVAGEVEARRLEDMAAQYLAEIKTVQRHGPYALGGWCLGGDVAFEMARQLEESGEQVAVLLMVDNPRPEFVAPETMVSPSRRVWNRIRTRLAMEWSNLAEVPWTQKPRFVVERVERLGARALIGVEGFIGRWVSIPHSRAYRQQQIAAAHEKVYEAYRPGRYAGPATLIRAEQQPYGRAGDSALGWEQYVDGEIQVIEAPGHRVGLLSEPRVETVAERIRHVMDQAFHDSDTSA
jgi:thioesterase domain-containing protein